ncbi:hypothetical protein [Streptomyces sp. DSM 118878]
MTPGDAGAAAPRRRGWPSRTETETGPATRDRIIRAARDEFSELGTSARRILGVREPVPETRVPVFGQPVQIVEGRRTLDSSPISL